MKQVIIVFVIIQVQGFVFGQNLVPNSGFEQVNDCGPTTSQQTIASIEYWFNHLSHVFSPDFFHSCFSTPDYSPPNTVSGFSLPKNGDGMAGIAMYPGFADYRETISISLNEPLQKDSAYCVSFWYKNSENKGHEYNTDMINFLFSSDTLTLLETKNEWLELYENQSDSTSNDWRKFQSFHIADGAEQFFSIGYMGKLNYSHSESHPDDLLYYFIDEVEVKQCNKDSLFNVSVFLPNVFTPNNDGYNDQYKIHVSNISTLEISVLNRWGSNIITYDGLTEVWDGRTPDGKLVSEGVYYVIAVGESKFGNKVKELGMVHVEF